MKKILSNALIITILAVLSLILFSCKSKQVKVSFETFGGNKIETVSVAQFGKLENIPTPIKDGYTFIDWYTDSLLQFPFNRQEELLRNMTLYAGYSINSYTITFVTNTATIIEPITLEYASAIPAIEIPYKEGHIFKGWYLDADFKTPNSYVYMTNRDITLYASFQADILSIFFYDADSDLYKTVNVSYGDSLVSSKIPGVPVKEGYTGVWDTTDFSSITQELHIYPVYTVRTFVVTYRFSNSTGSIFEGLTQNVEYGALLSAPSSYPVLEGYTFTLDSYDYNVPVTKDVTIILIYARNTYQVRFFGLYGNVIATYNVEHGNNATIPEIPQIGGYHYVGLDATTTNITSSIDIHLLYEVNNYTIVLYALGGEFASNSSDTVILTIPYLSNIGILEKPTKTGYTFTHYVIKNTSIIFTNIGTETMPINGFELTAVYQINHYDFTYNDFFGQTDLNYENYVTSGTAYPINNSLDYNSSLDLGSTVVNGYNLYQIVINSVIVYDGDTLLNTNYIVNENTLSDVISVYYTKVITTITISANGGYFDIENTMSILTLVGYFDSVITGVIEPHLENNGFVSFMLASNPYYFSQGQNFGTSDIVLSSRWHDLSLDTYTVTVSIHLQKTSFEDEEDILEDNISTYTFGNLEYLENLKPVINQYGYLFSSLVIDEDTPILDSEYVLVVTENILIGRIDIYYNRIITVITLFGNGGLFESNSSATLEVKGYFGDPINTLERPSREGFTFVVWFLNTGNIYNEGVNINFPLTSFTLSARWNINKYNITIVSHFEEAELPYNYLNPIFTPSSPSSNTTILNNVAYNTYIDFILDYEGFNFYMYQIDSNDYYDKVDEIGIVSASTIHVYYRKILLTVTFAQDNNYSYNDPNYEESLVTIYVLYNGTILNSDIPEMLYINESYLSGYVANWSHINFSNIKTDLNVVLLYSLTDIKSILFYNVDVIINISYYSAPNVYVLGESSYLFNLAKYGYTFLGWSRTNDSIVENNVILTYSTFMWDDFGSGQSQVYAIWKALSPFSTPNIIHINADSTSGIIRIYFTYSPQTVGGLVPESFLFTINTTTINVLFSSLATTMFSGVSCYLLEVTSLGDEVLFDFFDELFLEGTYFVKLQLLGDNINNLSSQESAQVKYENQISVITDETQTYDYHIIEQLNVPGLGNISRYVFFTDMQYAFPIGTTFDIVKTNDCINAIDNVLITSSLVGQFQFTRFSGGVSTFYYGLVVPYVNYFNYGQNYQTYLDETSNPGASSYLDHSDTDFHVGTANGFVVDVTMYNKISQTIKLSDMNMDYQVSFSSNGAAYTDLVKNGVDYEFNNYKYLSIGNNPNNTNLIELTSQTLDKWIKIVARPHYVGNAMDINEVTYIFKVNDGINAANMESLSQAYANVSIQTINVLAKINVKLRSSDLHPDGSPINQPSTSPFYRHSLSTSNDNLIVNGNYQSIDASTMPLLKVHESSDINGSALLKVFSTGYSVFYYDVKDEATMTLWNYSNLSTNSTYQQAFSQLEAEQFSLLNSNEFTMKNLTITGNTRTPYVDYSAGNAQDILLQEQLMLDLSGTANGIQYRNGSLTLDNVNVYNTYLGIYSTSFGYKDSTPTNPLDPTSKPPVTLDISNFQTDNNWGNALVTYGDSDITIKHSNIRQSGGPALVIADGIVWEGGYLDTNIDISADTVINNWISGDEMWFRAFGMSVLAAQLKSQLAIQIAQTGRSIIKLVNDPITGLPAEKLNLKFMFYPSSSTIIKDQSNKILNCANVSMYKDGTFMYKIDKNSVNMDTNPANDDPRVVNIGMQALIYPYQNQISLVNFINYFTQVVGAFMAAGLDSASAQAAANQIVMLGSVYNLNPVQTVQLAGMIQNYGSYPQNYYGYVNSILGSTANIHKLPEELMFIYHDPSNGPNAFLIAFNN